MKDFLAVHRAKVKGVLGCFDRVIFRGYLPLQDGYSMAQFLNQVDTRFRDLKSFLLEQSARVKAHAHAWAEREGRPFTYLKTRVQMERAARVLAERDGITQGLVCVYSVVEPCRTFSFRFGKGNPFVQSAHRKCLFLYYYLMDPRLGLVHIKLQTWFPMMVQVYLNAHEWLAIKLTENGVSYSKLDNVFVHLADIDRAQAFADRFASLNWDKLLDELAHHVNPLFEDLLKGQRHYWVTAQAEYATDILFNQGAALRGMYPRLVSQCMQCFGAKEVMGFLGRKLVGQFQGEVVTDLVDLHHRRIPGVRIKHRVKENWIKMYDKAGCVLRVETVINNPTEFRVRKSVRRHGRPTTEWVPMRKGVAYLFRYRDISHSANSRYLDALAVVDDPSTEVRELDRLTQRRPCAKGPAAKPFNPLARAELCLFHAIVDGADSLHGFTNRDIRARLHDTPPLAAQRGDPKRESAKVSRIIHRFHAHGLIAKIPRSRRWRTTRHGYRMMVTAIQIREFNFPKLLALAA